jgi:hypothetical protein
MVGRPPPVGQQPLLVNPPKPVFTLRWDEETRNWHSEFAAMAELPEEIRQVFEGFGYGCLAAETNAGIVHVCHAADSDIEGFANKPVHTNGSSSRCPPLR